MNLAQHPEVARFLQQLALQEPQSSLFCPICGKAMEPCQSSSNSVSVCCSSCSFHASVPRRSAAENSSC